MLLANAYLGANQDAHFEGEERAHVEQSRSSCTRPRKSRGQKAAGIRSAEALVLRSPNFSTSLRAREHTYKIHLANEAGGKRRGRSLGRKRQNARVGPPFTTITVKRGAGR